MAQRCKLCRNFLMGIVINYVVLSPTTGNAKKLDLPHFSAFKNCTFHIITIQVKNPNDLEEKMDSTAYDVDAIDSLSIRSRHYFALQRPTNHLTEGHLQQMLQCGNLLAKLNQSNSNFKFRVSPSPRQNCIVQFYIDPPNCPSWRKPMSSSYADQILSWTIFNPVIDCRLVWTRFLRQTISWRWAFIHVKTIATSDIAPFVTKHDIEDIVRRELEYFIMEIPTSPLTLTFFVLNNISNASNHEVASTIDFKYIVSEIETQTAMLLKLVEFSMMPNLQDMKTENLSILDIPDSDEAYKLYPFNIEDYPRFSDLENIIPFEIYHRAPFFQLHGDSISSHPYPTNWNKSEHVLGDVIHSLLFTTNVSCRTLIKNLKRIGMYTFLSSEWPKFQRFLPETIIVLSRNGEGYPAFPKTDNLYFVTCAPLGTTGLSLEGLISAFDGYIWLLIIVSASITKMISYTTEKYFGMIRKTGFHHQGIFCTLKILLGEHIRMKVFKSKMILISWLFVGIVISNAYEGENTSKLISPQGYLKYEKFIQVAENNFTVYTPIQLFF